MSCLHLIQKMPLLSFLHVRTLCPVLPQFPRRRRAGWALSLSPSPQALFDCLAVTEASATTWADATPYSAVPLCWICFCLRVFLLFITVNCSSSSVI
jgi:hypothetical protein